MVVDRFLHRRNELHGPLFPGRLGLVERDIGILKQGLGRGTVSFGDTDTGRDVERYFARRNDERRRHDVEQTLGHHVHAGLQGDTVGEDDELVAPESTDRVIRANCAIQTNADADEQLITGAVAQGVVDVLEVVEVEKERGNFRVLAS